MARPFPPTNLQVTQGEPTITITWDADQAAVSFTVYRANSLGGNLYVIGTTTTNMWVDTKAALDTVYWYSVSERWVGSGCSEKVFPWVSGYASAAPPSIPDSPTIISIMTV